SVDAALCRWALMLVDDPGAAFQELRRVLRPGGRVTVAVWNRAEDNPWATIPPRALVELGYAEPPDPNVPGMFALADPALLRERLESAGFVEVVVDRVALRRSNTSLEDYIDTQL